MSRHACLRCFAAYADWLYCLFAGRCPECGAALEELAAEPEEVLCGEY
jgi:predicted  nucleic acid-binding Zn-ribbon protein